jgi:hypothetical protein
MDAQVAAPTNARGSQATRGNLAVEHLRTDLRYGAGLFYGQPLRSGAVAIRSWCFLCLIHLHLQKIMPTAAFERKSFWHKFGRKQRWIFQ